GRNRASMKAVAGMLLASEATLASASFDETAARVFAASGASREQFVMIGRGFMSERRLAAVVERDDLPTQTLSWRYDTRPANSPVLRLLSASKLTFVLYHNNLLRRLLEGLIAGICLVNLLLHFYTNFCSENFVWLHA